VEVAKIKRLFLRFVAKMSDEQKQRRPDVCSDLTSQLTDNFLSKIITGDETW
jgi:hypothetical protein